jgi:hypothetical protein
MSYNDFEIKEQEIFKKWLKQLLASDIVTIEFKKADGQLRSMKATLKENLLPPKSMDSSTKKINDDICVVWDTEQNAWRSFRYDRMISVKFTLG